MNGRFDCSMPVYMMIVLVQANICDVEESAKMYEKRVNGQNSKL